MSSNKRVTKFHKFIVDRKLTQADIARGIPMDISTVNLFAMGRHNWNRNTLRQIVTFLKCSPNDIIDWEEWAGADTNKPLIQNTNEASNS